MCVVSIFYVIALASFCDVYADFSQARSSSLMKIEECILCIPQFTIISAVSGVGAMCLCTSVYTIMPMFFPNKDDVAPYVVLSVFFGIGTLCTAQTFSK